MKLEMFIECLLQDNSFTDFSLVKKIVISQEDNKLIDMTCANISLKKKKIGACVF